MVGELCCTESNNHSTFRRWATLRYILTRKWPACIQATGGSADQSEDCLSINIRTKPQSGERSSSELGYNGKFIADQTDFVLISLNYRLNIFVFPRNPATPANLGLMDRRLAMKRIRNNVEKFGGDVDRISVFGQSAGAGTIDFYSYAWAEDPIDNGFILLSATVNGFPHLAARLRLQSGSKLLPLRVATE
ncbi:Alpha/Beta hydrolase protein [Truncatella angustata]|uniref:Carboxylic ester hydrolase n=1 Tax=Truncatella angustata TaxID=152316 RepID=A0A9P8UC51_9PEZI|nr:Alpha/Beta hydrolase protein [Truncatella angustata]KAH6645337.1 Alpha/Beta hydrolase protein [Truncatella angustata]